VKPARAGSVAALAIACGVAVAAQLDRPVAGLDVFAQATAPSDRDARPALDTLASTWRSGYAAMVLELAEFSREPNAAAPIADAEPPPLEPSDAGGPARPGPGRIAPPPPSLPPASPVRDRLLRLLERQTRQRFGRDFERWHQ
jgi:hypothetical protein